MSAAPMGRRLIALALAAAAQLGCGDENSTPSPTASDGLEASAPVRSARESGSSVRWNRKAVAILRTHLIPGSPAPDAGRIHAYLSLAQYRAVLATRERQRQSLSKGPRPSLAGAAAGASVVILKEFYRTDAAEIAAELAAQRAGYPSAHSCETGAWHVILADAFPSEDALLRATAREASMSRIHGGLHYRFDGDAGLKLGRRAGRLALHRGIQ